jgi:hypothetical protein
MGFRCYERQIWRLKVLEIVLLEKRAPELSRRLLLASSYAHFHPIYASKV